MYKLYVTYKMPDYEPGGFIGNFDTKEAAEKRVLTHHDYEGYDEPQWADFVLTDENGIIRFLYYCEEWIPYEASI